VNLSIDPHTRTPHTDESTIDVDRQIGARLTVSAAYIRKRGGDFVGWTDTGGQYSAQTITLADGTPLSVLDLTNGTAARRFLLTNPAALVLRYDGVLVSVDRRLWRGWELGASYTYSRTRGMLPTSNATAAEAQFSTIARPAFLTFGQDPNDLTNASGRLPNDRPQIFRANGLVHLPWFGLLVSANLQCFSGRPWAPATQVTLPQGSEKILLAPRGAERLPSQQLLDLRVSKTIKLGKAGTADVMFDVLNLLNDSAIEGIQTDIKETTAALTANFGAGATFMDPRRAMIGVRLNLGR